MLDILIGLGIIALTMVLIMLIIVGRDIYKIRKKVRKNQRNMARIKRSCEVIKSVYRHNKFKQ